MTSTATRAPTPVVLCALLSLGACAGEAAMEAGPERRDSAGVELVVNAGRDRPLEWRFQPVLTLGGAVEGAEAFYEVYDGSVATGPDGIFVLDGGNRRVHAFGPDGAHRWSAGGEGDGPGELRVPTSISVDPATGVVSVLDLGKGGLVRFSAEGAVLGQEAIGGDPFGSGVEHLASGAAVWSSRQRLVDEDVERRMLALVRGTDTVRLQTHVREEGLTRGIRVTACGSPVVLRMGPFFEPGFPWDAAGERVVSSWGWSAYRVDVHEGGRRVRSVRRELEPVPVTEERVRLDHPDGFSLSVGGGEPCELDLDELMEQAGTAEVVPAVEDLALSPEGELWVRREVAGPEGPVDVFGPDGAYLGTLPAGSPFPVAFTTEGRPVTVERNELDVPRVVVYQVERGPG